MNLYRVTTATPVVERTMLANAHGVPPGLSVVEAGLCEYVVAEAVAIGPAGTLLVLIDHPTDDDAGNVVRAFAPGQWVEVAAVLADDGERVEVDPSDAASVVAAWSHR